MSGIVVDLALAATSVADLGILRPCLAPTIHCLGGAPSGRNEFKVQHVSTPGAATTVGTLTICWDIEQLRPIAPTISDDLAAFASRATPLYERAVEFAGYGVAICAVNGFLPGYRVTHFNCLAAPDMWLGLAEDRGIEVAGRRSGRANYENAIRLKRSSVAARPGLQEAWISVWGFDLAEGIKEKVI